MSVNIYCIDNDILKKLVTFQLFDKTLKLFNATYNQVNILETAQYKFRNDWEKWKKGKQRKSQNKLVKYEELVQLIAKLPYISKLDIDLEHFIELSEFEKIDEGEAILTVHAIEILKKDKSAQIFTGDKNFLRALAEANLTRINKPLKHRFWCLEQLILKNIDAHGFEAVRDCLVPVRDCDIAIKAVFGSGDKSSKDNSIWTLKNYIEEIRQETGSLLFSYP